MGSEISPYAASQVSGVSLNMADADLIAAPSFSFARLARDPTQQATQQAGTVRVESSDTLDEGTTRQYVCCDRNAAIGPCGGSAGLRPQPKHQRWEQGSLVIACYHREQVKVNRMS